MDQPILKPKVLYLDDEEENLLVFKSSFRKAYQIDTASSTSNADELIKNNRYDVIISDQRMPGVTGVEFLNSIPDEPRSIRIIMTGYSDIESVIDAINSGKIHKYIRKPWKKEELNQLLDEAIYKLLNDNHLYRESDPSANNLATDVTAEVKVKASDAVLSDEVKVLKQKVNDAYENVQLLGEIGQEITSTLNLNDILNKVYENVNHLMDANIFGIGTYNAEKETIDYQLAIEKGKRYKPYSRTMENKNQLPVWCIENKKEIFINDVNTEISNYIRNTVHLNSESAALEDGTAKEVPQSLIYMPLRIKDKIIGLITVQSTQKNAYNEYHLNTLRNISIYVATALENAKAYKQIEEQKEEIEKKKDELEQKVEERTEQLRFQKDELEDTFSKLKLLTEIGHEITSTLHLDTILNTIYKNVNTLMDASIFGIGIYDEDHFTINYQLAIENGKRYQPYTRSMNEKNQFPVWCIEHKKEIFINDVHKEYNRYIQNYKDANDKSKIILEDGSEFIEPLSLIYIPLLFNNKPIGVLSVQSFRKYAYNQYHLDILRSLASYITTAIQNAHSYQKMTEAFEQLKSTQSKLVESEKMASLGVLTAGVAHEINNPVNFISGGIQSLRDAYTDIKSILQMALTYCNNPDPKLLESIRLKQTEIELDELLPEVDELIQSITNGADRTAEIVRGLRNFSRLDEDDMKRASLEEGIDSTLVILNNQLKNRIDIIKDYGKIPEIVCFPGQLNQVFMNLIYNAADAIVGNGTIRIKTWMDNEQIRISVKDSGSGMSEEIRSRIFEPFFTTKDVGKGTGLGLSIAYGIIEKHKGAIDVQSEPGKGTTFTITLPAK
ncbi:MAG: ATP-binding protein [Bacteroidia bacterium]|jgi:signal transduction histidine kinase/CheY-like chemotaxis protein